jgi:16S rRNA (uracil1498-N3)-methyltransferase
LEATFLSNIELYYTTGPNNSDDLIISGEEVHHIKDVMRHKIGDEIYVSDGKGSIYKSLIETINKKNIQCSTIKAWHYSNSLSNFTFCLPRLRTQDRFEFALEKCVELGITNFIIFDSIRTVAKGAKLDRWNKILLAAMKQSLRAWLPQIKHVNSISEIASYEGKRVMFEQNSKMSFNEFLKSTDLSERHSKLYFVFGPEGGFADEEIAMTKHCSFVKLTDNRLRTETAVVTAASLLSMEYGE